MTPIIARATVLHTRPGPTSRLARYASSFGRPRRSRGRVIGLLSVAIISGTVVWAYPLVFKKGETAGPQRAEVEFEKARKPAVSKEDNRDLISSQHLQVKKSWENPGVYAWGSNAGRTVAPDSTDAVVKTPRRIPFFDGKLLRDLKLDQNFGAAVLENGDLVQWGVAFSQQTRNPTVTLKGKDLVKLALSRDRILALSSDGSVYSLPVSKSDQEAGEKQTASSWIPFWSSPASISYRIISPAKLSWGEKVIDVKSGMDHCLLLTSTGRVFSAASSTEEFPSKGQLGIPGLSWATRPTGPYDQPHEIATLRGFNVVQIATGDYHSVALDSGGRVFAFGDNSAGQLGFEPDPDIPAIDAPSLLPFSKLYGGTNLLPRVTSIAAGGSNTYFTVDATKVVSQAGPQDVAPARDLGRLVADTWACGEGLYGSLGTGKWTHVSREPTKIKALSGLYEFDEGTNKVIPIRLSHISVGSGHACAVMDNVTYVGATGASPQNDTNWGADIVWWGGNEYYQLGTGKRSNSNTPLYIGPLDGGEGDAEKGRRGEAHRFQITPRQTVRLGEGGKGRKVSTEQRAECGRYVTAVYSGT